MQTFFHVISPLLYRTLDVQPQYHVISTKVVILFLGNDTNIIL